MKTLKLSLMAALFVGAFGLLAATPTDAQMLCFACDCEDSCSTPCRYGPFVIDCPECNVGTCGSHGTICAGDPSCDPECSSTSSCTEFIYGDGTSETLNGTSQNSCIYGYGGNDTIDGNAGDDWLFGGNGTDTIYGDSGHDCLYGEGNDDHLDGGTGTNFGDGGSGTDTCVNLTTSANCP